MKKNLIYATSFALAAFSIIYELLIAQSLSLLAGNMVVWYSLTIGLFLGAMGIGSILSGKICRKTEVWAALFRIEIILASIGGLSIIAVNLAHILKNYYFVTGSIITGSLIFFSTSFLIIIIIGFLSGFELPFLIRIANEFFKNEKITNKILAFNYFGALLGAVIFPLFLISKFGVIAISMGVAFLNGLIAVIILFKILRKEKKFMFKLSIVGFVMTSILYVMLSISDVDQYFLKKYYYYTEASENRKELFSRMDDFPEIERIHSSYQNIDLVKMTPRISDFLMPAYSKKYDDPNKYKNNQGLFLNGDFQLMSNYEDVYHEYLVHVPIIVNGSVPKKVLIIGGGDGIINRELLKYSEVEKITHVDIDKKMIEVAKNNSFLRELNGGALENEKVEIIFADGYYFLKNNEEKFDAIYLDLPTPMDYNISKLYSKEFYYFAKEGLKENGFLAMDAPGTFLFYTNEEIESKIINNESFLYHYYSTLKAAGFKGVLPYVSGAEMYNQQAYAILENLIDNEVITIGDGINNKKITDKKKAVEKIIQRHMAILREGYIMAKKKDIKLDGEYNEFGVGMNFLDQSRFIESISFNPDLPKKIDQSKVNSILKPTLPDLPFWFTKLPYYE